MYLKQKFDTDSKIVKIKETTNKQQERLQLLSADKSCDNGHLEPLCNEFVNTNKLTHELAHTFIKAVYINADSSIDIEWKFKDMFNEN